MKRIVYTTLFMYLLFLSCGRNYYKDLHNAVGYGAPRDVQRFLDAGWDPNAQNLQGNTPLMAAALNKRHGVAVARILLDGGANIDAKDSMVGCTAIDSQWYRGVCSKGTATISPRFDVKAGSLLKDADEGYCPQVPFLRGSLHTTHDTRPVTTIGKKAS